MVVSLPAKIVGYLEHEGSALQKTGNYSDAEHFSKLAERRFVVCRVVLENGQGGTGFLIGKDLILTNNHVLDNADMARKAKAVFFHTTGGKGIEIDIDPDSFFYTSSTPDQLGFKSTTISDMDFTIVSIHSHPKIAEIEHFAFCIFGSQKPTKESHANIIHHPLEEDGTNYQKVSFRDNVVKNAELFTIHYTTSTMPGSSGSPVMDDEGNLIALHRATCTEILKALLEKKVLEALLKELFPDAVFIDQEIAFIDSNGISKKYPARCAPINDLPLYIFSKGDLKGQYFHEGKMPFPASLFKLIATLYKPAKEWALQFLKRQGVSILDHHKECNTAIPIHAICLHLQKVDNLSQIKARYEACQKPKMKTLIYPDIEKSEKKESEKPISYYAEGETKPVFTIAGGLRTLSTKDKELESQYQELFGAIKYYINNEYQKLKGREPRIGGTMTLSLDMWNFRYKHSSNDSVECIDLLELGNNDPGFQELLDKMVNCLKKIHPDYIDRRSEVHAGYRGDYGTFPVQRTTAKLKQLPSTAQAFSSTYLPAIMEKHAPLDRLMVMQRLAVGETWQRLVAKIAELLKHTEEDHKALSLKECKTNAAIKEKSEVLKNFQKDLNKLKLDCAKYQIDQFALQYILAAHPVNKNATDEELVEKAEEVRGNIIKAFEVFHAGARKDEEKYGSISKVFHADARVQEKKYATDVGGMLIRMRWDYSDYCKKFEARKARVSVEEVRMREAFAFVQDPSADRGKLLMDGFNKEIAEYSPLLRSELQKAFFEMVEDMFSIVHSNATIDPNLPVEDYINEFRTSVIRSLRIPIPK